MWGRGVNRGLIFEDEADRKRFLEILGASTERYGILVHAYVLMDNHYHLIAQTPEGNLSRAMQWIATSYSMWHNRKHGRIGPLFQGRYGSSIVEDSRWAYELSVYLHLNPVRVAAYDRGKRRRKAERAGISRPPRTEQVSAQLEATREYRWSTYRSYGGYESGEKWVTRRVLLGRACRGPKAEQQAAYRRNVQGWIKRGVEATRAEQFGDRLAVGSEAFIERLKKSAGKLRREEAGKGRMRRKWSFREIAEAVENEKGAAWEEFRNRYGDWGKGHVYWFARQLCGMTLKEIGQASGGVDYAAVSDVLRRYERALSSGRTLRREKVNITRRFLNLET